MHSRLTTGSRSISQQPWVSSVHRWSQPGVGPASCDTIMCLVIPKQPATTKHDQTHNKPASRCPQLSQQARIRWRRNAHI
jgi:hypothetical protein